MSRPPLKVWDVVFQAAIVLALIVLAVFTFDRSFSDRSYLLVGGIGALVPIVMAVLLYLAGMKVGRFAIFVYVMFLPLAASAVFQTVSVAAVREVLRATVDAPNILLTTIPPVDAEGAVLALPFALAYAAAASSTWLALNSRSPTLPLFPILMMLAMCVLFGTEETQSVLVKSAVFAGLALWWVGLRSSAQVEIEHARRGAIVRGVGSAVVVGLVVLMVTSAVGDVANRLVLRGVLGTGYDVSRADNPLSDFREYTTETGDGAVYGRRLLTVKGLPKKVPMRFVVLDTYTGEEWEADNDTVDGTREDRFQQLGSEVGTTASGRSVKVHVRPSGLWNSEWLPVAGQLTTLEFDGPLARSPQELVRFNPATGSAMVIDGITKDDSYTFTAVLPDTEFPADAKPYPNDGNLQPEGAFLDEYLQAWKDIGSSNVDRVLLLAEYLKANGIYSDGAAVGDVDVPRGHSKERLAAFAYDPVGNGEQYAAFLALAANRLGVPARVVVGAQPGKQGIIRGKDVEAWVELRLADGTWRVLPTDSFQSSAESRGSEQPQSAEQFIEDEVKQEAEQQRADEEAGEGRPAANTSDRVWWLMLLGLIAAVTIGGVPAAKAWRRRRRRGRSGVAAVVGAWRELVDEAHDLGVPVLSDAPRPAQAAGIGGGASPEELRQLAERADLLVFAPDTPEADAVQAYWADVESAQARLRQMAPIGRRWKARWRAGSLRTSLRRRRS